MCQELIPFPVWMQYMVMYQILLQLAVNVTFWFDGSSLSNAQAGSFLSPSALQAQQSRAVRTYADRFARSMT